MPATSPTASQARWSAPASSRLTSQAISTQTSTSKVVVLSRWPRPSTADPATQIAARSCASRPAPNSRAVSADRTTTVPMASAGRMRTETGERPSQFTMPADSSGSQGWLVDVAEGGMVAGHDEVQLVAVEAVLVGDDQQDHDQQAANRQRPGQRKPRAAACC